MTVFSQTVNQRIYDNKSGKEILLGKCTKQGLKLSPFNEWFDKGYESYELQWDVLSNSKKYLNENLKIVVIFGTWCDDTQEQLPRFMKVMDNIGYTPDMLELIAVDRTKSAGTIDISSYNVKQIPTFIFFKNGKELGRIIESPRSTMEKEIISILKKQ